MITKSKNYLLVLVLLATIFVLPNLCLAFSYQAPLEDNDLEQRAQKLFREIRCVVCVSQSVNDSETELAVDLRTLIRKKIAAGESDEEIRKFLTSRYGNQILLAPPIENSTYVLWFGPIIIFVIGLLIIYFKLSTNLNLRKKKN